MIPSSWCRAPRSTASRAPRNAMAGGPGVVLPRTSTAPIFHAAMTSSTSIRGGSSHFPIGSSATLQETCTIIHYASTERLQPHCFVDTERPPIQGTEVQPLLYEPDGGSLDFGNAYVSCQFVAYKCRGIQLSRDFLNIFIN
jgi:hypothetical protein